MFNVRKGETNIHVHIAVFAPQLQDILSCVRNTYAVTVEVKSRTCAYSFAYVYMYTYTL